MNLIEKLEQEEIERMLAGKTIPEFAPGDTVIVSVNVVEGTRKRLQAYEGVVISKRNRGLNSNFIVRKISSGEGVERTFQTYSPLLASIAVAFSVLMSARVSEVRTAQQLGALTAIPGVVLYIGLITGVFSLDLASLAVMCGVFAAVDAGLALAARATFHREEILTRWA